MQDLSIVIKGVADFLNVTFTEAQGAALLDHLSFVNMKNNKAVNFEECLQEMKLGLEGQDKFIRQGEVGAWKNVISEDFTKLFDKWTERYLEGSDYPQLKTSL